MARKLKIVNKHFDEVSQKPDSREQPQHSNRLKLRIDDLKTLRPLTKNQKLFFDSYANDDQAIMLYGSVGSGKTLIALYKALETVLDKGNPYSKVILVRSIVASREIGYLKGSAEEKLSAYTEPYIGLCSTLFNRKDAYTRLVEQDHLEVISSSFLRGCTFDNSIIIFDEFQNENWSNIQTVLTRCGNNSKIIFAGDFRQNDLTKNRNDQSGFETLLKVAKHMDEFTLIEFDRNDIVRSEFVKSFIIACEDLNV
jgi:predicted ribonuclease YlaK